MFSMSRSAWLSQFFRPVFTERQPRPKRTEKTIKNHYRFAVPHFISDPAVISGVRFSEHTVEAHTKSEARALVKQALGLDRLPEGTFCLPLVDSAAA